jgi:hypothetical protein
MSCPFYAHALVSPGPVGWSHLIANPGSNQCALITSANSPCWMDVAELVLPDWERCPRNPDFVARRPHDRRIAQHNEHLAILTAARPGAV